MSSCCHVHLQSTMPATPGCLLWLFMMYVPLGNIATSPYRKLLTRFMQPLPCLNSYSEVVCSIPGCL